MADANAQKENERVANEHRLSLAKFEKQGKSMATMAQASETERKIMALQAEAQRAAELKAEVEMAQQRLDATRRTPTADFRGMTPTPAGDHNEDEQRSTAFQLFTGAAPKKAAGAHPRRGSVEEEESFGFGDENDLQEAGVTPERAEERSKRFFEGSESLAGFGIPRATPSKRGYKKGVTASQSPQDLAAKANRTLEERRKKEKYGGATFGANGVVIPFNSKAPQKKAKRKPKAKKIAPPPALNQFTLAKLAAVTQADEAAGQRISGLDRNTVQRLMDPSGFAF